MDNLSVAFNVYVTSVHTVIGRHLLMFLSVCLIVTLIGTAMWVRDLESDCPNYK